MNLKLFAALAALAFAATVAPVGASQDNLVTVTLEVDGTKDRLNGFTATCDVTVPAGADGSVVLDAAVAKGCLDSWTFDNHGYGRYVTSINEVRDLTPAFCLGPCFFWHIAVDGESAQVGIDGYVANQGSTLAFTYETRATWLWLELP